MIALWRSGDGIPDDLARDIEANLGLFEGGPVRQFSAAGSKLFYRDNWRVACPRMQDRATTVLLFGWLDDAGELRNRLGIRSGAANGADLYLAALERWGDDADRNLNGSYCAIAATGEGAIRLARTPWSAPPLYWYRHGKRLIVSPHLRVLFAGGAPEALRPERMRDALAFDFHENDDETLYDGIRRVPLGATVRLDAAGARVKRWYDPGAVEPVRLARDADYVEQARALLDRAARNALAATGKPVLALSSGLDSPLVATALLRQPDCPRPLQALTARPHTDWSATAGADPFDDEWHRVAEFASLHPGLEVRAAPHGSDEFDTLAREIFRSSRLFNPAFANLAIVHQLWRGARRLGANTILTAELGNQSFSARGDWALAEDLRGLRLLRMWRNLSGASRQEASLPRRVWRHSLSPLLPSALQRLPRRLAGKPEALRLASMLGPEQRRAYIDDAAREGSAWHQGLRFRSRRDLARLDHAVCDRGGADVTLALEEIHGICERDVTAYRPLIEFCLGLPTGQFMRNGHDRYLARRMARGVMPEAQRIESRMAMHNADWHLRIGRRREELLAYAESMRAHPLLSEMLDCDRLEATLRDWPETAPQAPEEMLSNYFGVTSGILAGRFLGAIEDRNAL